MKEVKDFQEIMDIYAKGKREKAGEMAIEALEGYLVGLRDQIFGSYKTYYDELYQEGCVGILKALPNYDPKRGMPTTYFKPYIQHQMSAFITNFVSQSTAHYQKNSRAINSVINRYQREGKEVSDTDIAIETGINLETIIQTKKIDGKVINHIESTESDFFSMQRQEKSPEEISLENEDQKILIKSIQGLKEIEKDVIVLIYFEDFSQKKTAEKLHMRVEDVRNIKEQALKKLRHKIGMVGMESEYPKHDMIEEFPIVEKRNYEDTLQILQDLE